MPQFELQQARPPYFTFETRRIERRQSADQGGMLYAVFEDFVIITPQGSKDRVEKLVADWFTSLAERVRMDMYPEAWFNHHKQAYEAWKLKKEIPLEGTPMRGWVLATEAEQEKALTLQLRTVEDLANANQETIGRLGMGGMMLKNRALDYLQAQKDTGPLVARVEAQNTTIMELQKLIRTQGEQLAAFEQMLKMMQPQGQQFVTMPHGNLPVRETPKGDDGDTIGEAIDSVAATIGEE